MKTSAIALLLASTVEAFANPKLGRFCALTDAPTSLASSVAPVEELDTDGQSTVSPEQVSDVAEEMAQAAAAPIPEEVVEAPVPEPIVALKLEPAEKKSPWVVPTPDQREAAFRLQEALLTQSLLLAKPTEIPVALKLDPVSRTSPWAVMTPEQREAAFQQQEALLSRTLLNKPPRVVPVALKVEAGQSPIATQCCRCLVPWLSPCPTSNIAFLFSLFSQSRRNRHGPYRLKLNVQPCSNSKRLCWHENFSISLQGWSQ